MLELSFVMFGVGFALAIIGKLFKSESLSIKIGMSLFFCVATIFFLWYIMTKEKL